jgi:hypothetical protein
LRAPEKREREREKKEEKRLNRNPDNALNLNLWCLSRSFGTICPILQGSRSPWKPIKHQHRLQLTGQTRPVEYAAVPFISVTCILLDRSGGG